MHNDSGEIVNESRTLSIFSVLEAAGEEEQEEEEGSSSGEQEEQGTNHFSSSNWEQQLAAWNATEQRVSHRCLCTAADLDPGDYNA